MPDIDFKKIFWKKLEAETVVLNYETNAYFVLNGIGGFIWGLLVDKKTVPEITEALCREYKVDYQTAEQDLCAYLKRLEAEGILARSGTNAS